MFIALYTLLLKVTTGQLRGEDIWFRWQRVSYMLCVDVLDGFFHESEGSPPSSFYQ